MENLKYSIKPNFNFFYELLMPTGRKIRNTLVILILYIITYVLLFVFMKPVISNANMPNAIDILNIVNTVSLVFIGILILKISIHLIVQIWQYRCISYKFYEDYLEYEDSFLNQNKKTLRYDNIREIEVRRTIWDRINNYGIIIIYTNAEKSSNNGLVLYGVKNPIEVYKTIDEVVHYKKQVNSTVVDNASLNTTAIEILKKEEDFKNSLNSEKRGE